VPRRYPAANLIKKEAMTMNQNPIVFTRFQSQGGAMFNDIYSIDPDGANEIKLTTNPGPDGEYVDNAAPRYNKAKTMLAFVSNRNNPARKFNIFFLDLATKKTAQITTGNLDIMNVDWSHDDRRLVFSCRDEKGLLQIHTVNMDGTGFTKLTEGPAEHANPLWSPRGDLITYVEFLKDSTVSHVWVMDPEGRKRKRLTGDEAEHSNPSWSPDGSWIVFRCNYGEPHLRRINVDTNEVFLFEPPSRGADSSPIWSGNEIVFSSNCDWEGDESVFNLYKMTSAGENIRRLTNNKAFEYCGDW
jgi:Tol biopolymer transport system component